MRVEDQIEGEASRSVRLRKRERERQREREEEKKWIKNNKEKIFKWSGKKNISFDAGCIIKWRVKCYKIGFLDAIC